jgi:hypothetical protein
VGTEYGVGYYIDGLNNNDNWVEGPVTKSIWTACRRSRPRSWITPRNTLAT